MRYLSSIVAAVAIAAMPVVLLAQQATVGAPFGQANHSFFEQSGVGFDIRGPGFFFRQNSLGQALPPFGGVAPAAGASLGFAAGHGSTQGSFNFAFGQGSRSSLTTQSPSVTISNGETGTFSAGSWTPFVIGAIPVVGNAPGIGVPFGPAGSSSVLDERLRRIQAESEAASTAPTTTAPSVAVKPALDLFQAEPTAKTISCTAIPSVATIRQSRAAQHVAESEARQQEISALVAAGESALAANKPGVARIYFRQAARRAKGEQQAALNERIRQLDQ